MVIELRKTLLLPLDDLLAVTREFIHPNVSRSGLDRCLRRHGVSHLQALMPQPEDEEQPQKTFKDDEPGFVHVDIKYLPQLPDETAHRYLVPDRKPIEFAKTTLACRRQGITWAHSAVI